MSNTLKKKSIQEYETFDGESLYSGILSKGRPRSEFPDEDIDELNSILNIDEFEVVDEFSESGLKINVPKNYELTDQIKKVSIVRDDNEIVEIDPRDLEKILSEGRDIKKVVIEQIKFQNEAERVTLHYGKKHIDRFSKGNILSLAKEVQKTEEGIDILEIESLINQNFIDSKKAMKSKKEVEVPKEESDLEEKSLKRNLENQRILKPKNRVHESKEKNDENEQKVFEKKISQSLNPFSREIFQDEKATFVEGKNKVKKDIDYTQRVLLKRKHKIKNQFYYKVKNHMELFNIGQSYLKDLQKGVKNFAFSSLGLDLDRQKTILGITSFFNYHSDKKVTIFTQNIEDTFFYEYISKLKVERTYFFDETVSLKHYKTDGIDLYEYAELKRVHEQLEHYSYEELLDEIVESSEVVFWDLPKMEIVTKEREIFFPIIRCIDNASIIVGEEISKFKEVKKQIKFFKKYQVKIKGLLVNRLVKDGDEEDDDDE